MLFSKLIQYTLRATTFDSSTLQFIFKKNLIGIIKENEDSKHRALFRIFWTYDCTASKQKERLVLNVYIKAAGFVVPHLSKTLP